MKPTPFTGTVRSPCVSICRIEPDTGYCVGCHRTIEEIADWAMMSDERKRSVWQQIGLRREGSRAPGNPAGSPQPAPPEVTPAPDTEGR